MGDTLITFSPTTVSIINASAGGLCFVIFKLLGEDYEITGDIIRCNEIDLKYE